MRSKEDPPIFLLSKGKESMERTDEKNIEIIRSNEITGPFDPRAPKIRQDPD